MTSNGETLNGLDISEIPGERIKMGLIEAVKKRLNSDNVELCIEHGSKKGDNFIGEIYRILYKDVNDKKNENQSPLILKIAPRNLLRREKLRLRALFLREISMYDQVCKSANRKSDKIGLFSIIIAQYFRFYHISMSFKD